MLADLVGQPATRRRRTRNPDPTQVVGGACDRPVCDRRALDLRGRSWRSPTPMEDPHPGRAQLPVLERIRAAGLLARRSSESSLSSGDRPMEMGYSSEIAGNGRPRYMPGPPRERPRYREEGRVRARSLRFRSAPWSRPRTARSQPKRWRRSGHVRSRSGGMCNQCQPAQSHRTLRQVATPSEGSACSHKANYPDASEVPREPQRVVAASQP